MKDLSKLPDNLPVPVDDGACSHLLGKAIPSVPLIATSGEHLDLGAIAGVVILYFYPMIGRPTGAPLAGWNEIPGARGCTPQSCAFRDHYSELRDRGASVFGVSAQPLRLPTFEYNKSRLIKRITMIAVDSVIRKVFYPVFPPDRNAEDVLEWFRNRKM